MGSGRSGTSMLAGSLANSGFNIGGKGHGPNEGNPKGYFETKEVNGINDKMLFNDTRTTITSGSRHGWLTRFPIDGHPKQLANTESLIRQLVWGQRPFCLKDPRFCYTLPIWRPYLMHTAFICVFRNPAQVVSSIMKNCATAPYLSKIEINEDICYDIWMCMYRHIVSKHMDHGSWLFLSYEQILKGNGLDQVEGFLETKVDRDFVDPSLCREEKIGDCPRHVRYMFNTLCGLADCESEKING